MFRLSPLELIGYQMSPHDERLTALARRILAEPTLVPDDEFGDPMVTLEFVGLLVSPLMAELAIEQADLLEEINRHLRLANRRVLPEIRRGRGIANISALLSEMYR